MKRALAALAALLLALPAAAAPAKLAVILSQQGTSGDQNFAALAPLMQNGTPFDPFYVDARTWGASNTADSTWFRERYAAVLIVREAGQADGTPVASGPYSTKFQNASGVAGFGSSPLSGRWRIPVFVLSPNRCMPSTATYTDSTKYINGIVYTSPAGTVGKPTTTNGGTWRYRSLCRLRGSIVDTLYGDPRNYGCRPSAWAGVGTVAALVWADTTFGGGVGCTAGDTAVAVWRYRPHDGMPGIYFSTMEQGLSATTNIATGVMIFLQYIYTITDIRPTRAIKVPFVEHDAEPGVLDATGIALTQQLHDTLNTYGFKRWIASPVHATEQAQYGGALAGFRAEIASRGNRWFPFTYFNTGTDWTGAYYALTDTAGVRSRWNALTNTASHRDSMGLAVRGYLPTRVVTASGITGVNGTGRVLADAGTKIIESTVTAPQTNWTFQYAPWTYQPYAIPGNGETRYIWCGRTVAIRHSSTFSVAKSGAGDAEWIGSLFVTPFAYALGGGTSLYWHTGGANGPTSTDPYWSYLATVMAKYFTLFDRVIQVDTNFENIPFTPRRSYTAAR